jgi:hypothetical protein
MKILIGLFLLGLPAAAQAGGMGGCGHGCGHAATGLYAVLAALGYWVFQHASKETGCCVKPTGSVVGMALVIIGLLGLLCGVGSHVKGAMHRQCSGEGMGMHEKMEGGMGMDKMGGMQGMPEKMKAPEAAKKAK